MKGLVDPRNLEALGYIMERIRDAGYHADYHVINSYDYGVMQNRVRIYIVGFLDHERFERFSLPPPKDKQMRLGDLLGIEILEKTERDAEMDLFGREVAPKQMSLSASGGMNDYFLYNDIRNGDTTIHSWDLLPTTKREKQICLLLLRNRRKSIYGCLDGNPLSLKHFRALDGSIAQKDLDGLVALGIFAAEDYEFRLTGKSCDLTAEEEDILSRAKENRIIVDELKADKNLFKVI